MGLEIGPGPLAWGLLWLISLLLMAISGVSRERHCSLDFVMTIIKLQWMIPMIRLASLCLYHKGNTTA